MEDHLNESEFHLANVLINIIIFEYTFKPVKGLLTPGLHPNPYPNLLKTRTCGEGMGFCWVGYG